MKISILSVFPNLYDSFLQTSLIGRAQEKGFISVEREAFFSYVSPKERIDEPIFGHGAGMVIRPDVMEKAIDDMQARHGTAFKVFFSPQGKKLDQKQLESLTKKIQDVGHVMLIAGRYEGMDARVEEVYADVIVSIGDFVVMGGDIPAMLFLEGFLRLIPGVVGKKESVEDESFSGPFIDWPVYAPPVVWKDRIVPEVVRSGNHKAIKNWEMAQAAQGSVANHFEWLRSFDLNDADLEVTKKFIPPHYVVLMHGEIIVGDENRVSTSSVTSIDIHDIARAAKTYNIKNYFIVTPLQDQQKIVHTLLGFWKTEVGINYNPHRHEAVSAVEVKDTLDDVIKAIEQKEGIKPLIIATSAKDSSLAKNITFFDQSEVWRHKRPVLFLFGTGRGLADTVLSRCDYILNPIKGFSKFNHLSVRSAVAIALDRWLGIQKKSDR